MFVEFNTMPASSRVWIYLSDTLLSDKQVSELEEKLTHFCTKWTRHGEALKSSFLIKHNRFIILAVDESYQEISGCAINKSIKLMKDLEEEYYLQLMNRLNMAYITNEEISVVDFNEFKELAKQNSINADTLVFNNLVETKAAFEKEWQIPASQSWHARFLN